MNSCPAASGASDRILLGHGGGGRLMQRLLAERISRICVNGKLPTHDATVFDPSGQRLAMTTDSYVIHPLFFPGGDIGSLAINGTVNDLAMAGAQPKYLSLAFILEEGLLIDTFDRIIDSIRRAADAAELEIITGDTKVVERGKGDGIFINTTGIGFVAPGIAVHPAAIRPGDAIILSGDIGRHGVTVMNARQDQGAMQLDIISDCAPLHLEVKALLDAHLDVHCLRDLTRGGLVAALHELAHASDCSAIIDESAIPVERQVAAYCEILGLEPYYLANEGRFICILPPHQTAEALAILHNFSGAKQASVIGSFHPSARSPVRLQTEWGAERDLALFSGEQLPRIC